MPRPIAASLFSQTASEGTSPIQDVVDLACKPDEGEPLTSSSARRVGFATEDETGRRLTADEAEWAKRSIRAGMEPARARAEVLGGDVPNRARGRSGRSLAVEAMRQFANEEMEGWEEW